MSDNKIAFWDHEHTLNSESQLTWDQSSGTLGIGTSSPSSSIVLGESDVVFNENGYDVDFRVEGSSEPNLFLVDASKDEVLVNNSPVVTEDRLRSVVEDVLETKQENDLLKRFAQSLLERLYGEGE